MSRSATPPVLIQSKEEDVPYSIAAGNIIEYTLDMRLNGQRCLNVYHYRYKAGSPTITDGAAALLAWTSDTESAVGGIPQATKLAMSSLVKVVGIKAQVIYPTRRAYSLWVPTLDGARDINALPVGVSACLSLYQDQAGRGLTGRKEIPGLLMTDVEESMFTVDAKLLVNAIGMAAKQDQTIGGVGNIAEAIIFKRGNPVNSNTISGYGCRPEVRYLTRRTVGRGE